MVSHGTQTPVSWLEVLDASPHPGLQLLIKPFGNRTCTERFQTNLKLVWGCLVNSRLFFCQNRKVSGFKTKNKQLKDTKTLHKGELQNLLYIVI